MHRNARSSYGFLVAFGCALLTLCGVFSALFWGGPRLPFVALTALQALAALIWLSTFVRRAPARFQADEKGRLTASMDLEMAL